MNREACRVAILGGGLAGTSAAVALAREGCRVTLIEKRAVLGGRAGSLPDSSTGGYFDNCQHILMPCFTNLLDFYRAVGAIDKIHFHREIHFLVPPGRLSTLRAGVLPAPLHCAASFLRLGHLGLADRLRIARFLLAFAFHKRRDPGPDSSAAGWLKAQGQSRTAIEHFWHPVLVSALNEDLDRVSASCAAMVFRMAFLSSRRGWWLGIPTDSLNSLYGNRIVRVIEEAGGQVLFRSEVRSLAMENGLVTEAVLAAGDRIRADRFISAFPWLEADSLLGFARDESAGMPAFQKLEPSPITCVHLWYDRPVTDLPFAALPGSQVHWFFNKSKNFGMPEKSGTYLQLVTSASRAWLPLAKAEVLDIALGELARVLPRVRNAALVRSRVIKEPEATFCPSPGSDRLRPGSRCAVANLYLAGDWTQTAWPATMEGAVRSGYAAAEAVLCDEGRGRRLLVPDIPPDGLMRFFEPRHRREFPPGTP